MRSPGTLPSSSFSSPPCLSSQSFCLYFSFLPLYYCCPTLLYTFCFLLPLQLQPVFHRFTFILSSALKCVRLDLLFLNTLCCAFFIFLGSCFTLGHLCVCVWCVNASSQARNRCAYVLKPSLTSPPRSLELLPAKRHMIVKC